MDGFAQPPGLGLPSALAAVLRALEWSLAADADPDDLRAVKRANSASWITLEGLRHAR